MDVNLRDADMARFPIYDLTGTNIIGEDLIVSFKH